MLYAHIFFCEFVMMITLIIVMVLKIAYRYILIFLVMLYAKKRVSTDLFSRKVLGNIKNSHAPFLNFLR